VSLPAWLSDRRFVAGLVLVLSAFVGALLFRGSGSGTVQVLAASHDLSVGEVIGPSDIVAVAIQVDDGALRQLVSAERRSTVVGELAARRVMAHQLLSPSDVAASIPPAREVSIAVSADHSPSGRLATGNRVDVLATYGEGASARTVVVAHGVEVVAVSSEQALIGAAGDASSVSAITVSCDPGTASMIVFASRSAKVDVVRVLGRSDQGAESVSFDNLGHQTSTPTMRAGTP
jgi:Flp pilus assembly protein CpaB